MEVFAGFLFRSQDFFLIASTSSTFGKCFMLHLALPWTLCCFTMAIMLANGRWRLAVVAGLVVVRQAGEVIFAPFFFAVFFSRIFYYYLILSDYPCSEACTGGRVTFCTYILHKFLGSKQSCALIGSTCEIRVGLSSATAACKCCNFPKGKSGYNKEKWIS